MMTLFKKDQLKFWTQKLVGYEKKYAELKKRAPESWWHDEYWDNQMRVLEDLIVGARQKITELSLSKS